VLEEQSGERIGASVDLGSTSVHLLVARLVDHGVEPIIDESVFLGLGAAAGDRGVLGAVGRELLIDALTAYASTGRRAGASDITFVGTEPLRRLADGARIVAEVDAATGVPLHVLSHDEEAFLTLVGVTAGRSVDREMLVVDIGGGSSEFVSIAPGRRAVAAGVRVGAAELTSRIVAHDPPTDAEVAALRAAAREEIAAAPASRPQAVVVVGGTVSNLVKVVPTALVDRELSRTELAAAIRVVRSDPAEVIAANHGIRAARARILGAGAAILEAIAARYGVSAIRVADAGIREGTILAVAHAGVAWRDRLEVLAHGWRS
jgi:exopolyphosphatase/guanosine-5'-triphosphate,3'-diphosphate pyrophosphatase